MTLKFLASAFLSPAPLDAMWTGRMPGTALRSSLHTVVFYPRVEAPKEKRLRSEEHLSQNVSNLIGTVHSQSMT